MKLSVSLPDEDVRFLDEYARMRSRSRSAAVHEAIGALRHETLGGDYEAAWAEWRDAGEHQVWDQASAEGL